MTTITSVGNTAGVLAANVTTYTTVTDELSSFFSNTFHLIDVFSPSSTFTVISQSDTQIVGYDAAAGGEVTLNGTGFLGTSGTITSGSFTSGSFADPVFTPDGTGSFSFTGTGMTFGANGIVSNVNTIASIDVTQGTDHLAMTGTIGVDSLGNLMGTTTSENFTTLGITSTLTGHIDASDQIGPTTSIVISDGSGDSITLAGAFDASHYFTGHTLVSDIVTDPYFISGADTFNILGGGTWTGADGADHMNGSNSADTFFGGNGNDFLTGNGGNDVLGGGTGADSMTGGLGDDTYYVDNALDKVIELAAQGTDTVDSTISYTLAANVENLVLDAAAGAINGTGNALDNTITGNASANTLDGGTGNNTLIGGDGNDTYIVHSTGDAIVENSAQGNDTAVIAYSNTDLLHAATVDLAAYPNVENLKVTGTGLFNLTGDSNDNILTGNASVNVLTGGGGNDTFIGGAGADTMNGGSGNDTYYVDNAGDVITDTSGADTVIDSMTSGSYTLAAGLENLTMTGTASIGAVGNAGANIITGNAGANRLDDGGAGAADTLIGGLGNDTYIVNNSSDIIEENAGQGADSVQSSVTYDLSTHGLNVEYLTLTGSANVNASGNSLNNIITGNSGDNTLDGEGGIDRLAGGAGNDTYLVDLINVSGAARLQDTVTDTSGTNDSLDLRTAGDLALGTPTTLTLATGLENMDISATGSNHLNITGNAANNILTGNDWDNTINGGLGADTLIGGNGNDTYILSSAGDVVQENGTVNSTSDTIVATWSNATTTPVTLDLANYANVENIKVTGTGLFNLTGDSHDNILTGNASVNVMTGGDGNDTYYVTQGDTVVESSPTGGTDTIVSGVNWTLGANLENLTLTGTANITGTGNALDNVITGNSGSNVLTGNDGNDTIYGGLGNDIMTGGAGNDTLDGGAGLDRMTGGAGIDTFVFHAAQAVSAINMDAITDFQAGAGGDILDIHDVLTGYVGGSVNAFVHLTASGANTLVSVDVNGPTGGATFVDIAVLQNVSAASLIDADHMVSAGNLIV